MKLQVKIRLQKLFNYRIKWGDNLWKKYQKLWEELKFELGSVGIETLPKDKQEVYIGMGNRNADVYL